MRFPGQSNFEIPRQTYNAQPLHKSIISYSSEEMNTDYKITNDKNMIFHIQCKAPHALHSFIPSFSTSLILPVALRIHLVVSSIPYLNFCRQVTSFRANPASLISTKGSVQQVYSSEHTHRSAVSLVGSAWLRIISRLLRSMYFASCSGVIETNSPSRFSSLSMNVPAITS